MYTQRECLVSGTAHTATGVWSQVSRLPETRAAWDSALRPVVYLRSHLRHVFLVGSRHALRDLRLVPYVVLLPA